MKIATGLSDFISKLEKLLLPPVNGSSGYSLFKKYRENQIKKFLHSDFACWYEQQFLTASRILLAGGDTKSSYQAAKLPVELIEDFILSFFKEEVNLSPVKSASGTFLHWPEKHKILADVYEEAPEVTNVILHNGMPLEVNIVVTRLPASSTAERSVRTFFLDSELPVTFDEKKLSIMLSAAEEGAFKSSSDNINFLKNEIFLLLSDHWRHALRIEHADSIVCRMLKKVFSPRSVPVFVEKAPEEFFHSRYSEYCNRLYFRLLEEEKITPSEIFEIASIIKEGVYLISKKLLTFELLLKNCWSKQRFVKKVDYFVPVSYLSESLLDEVVDNSRQWKSWLELSLISNSEYDSDSLERKAVLKEKRNLPVNTAFFGRRFRYTLLSLNPEILSDSAGLVVRGDNYHALKLLTPGYQKKIAGCYIDPPYNTEFQSSSRMSYRDSFERSSWLSLVAERIEAAIPLLSSEAALFASIDAKELSRLIEIIEEGPLQYAGVFSWRRTRTGGHLSNVFNQLSEFVVVATGEECKKLYGGTATPSESQPLVKSSNRIMLLEFAPGTLEFPDFQGCLEAGRTGKGKKPVCVKKGSLIVDGFNADPVILEGPFVWTQGKLEEELDGGARIVVKRIKSLSPRFFRTPRRHKPLPGFADQHFPVGTNEDGSKRLFDLFGTRELHTYPKPVSLVCRLIESCAYFKRDGYILDFFAGSGTTAEAVLQLNREKEYENRFIVIEMGESCNSIIIPRIQKLMFSSAWHAGVPESFSAEAWSSFCYLELESFEESLNLLLSDDFYQISENGQTLEVRGELFEFPVFKESIAAVGTKTDTEFDLIETFNLLLGLSKVSYRLFEDTLIIEGSTHNDLAVLVIWADRVLSSLQVLENAGVAEILDEVDALYINANSPVIWRGRVFEPIEVHFRDRMFLS